MVKVDRRVARTKQTLRDALVRLVLERGWDEVSVKDLCDAANVGRSTFYAHFGDKEDLLVSGLDDLADHLRAPRPKGDGVVLAFVAPLVEHALEFRPMFRAIVGRHSGQVVQRRFRQVVLALVAEELDLDESDGIARFVAGGLVEVLISALDAPGARAADVDAAIQGAVARMVAR